MTRHVTFLEWELLLLLSVLKTSRGLDQPVAARDMESSIFPFTATIDLV